MHRIDSDGAVVALETPAAVGSTVGFFSEGNPATGVVATKVSSDWANAIQEELVSLITGSGAGLSLDKTVQNQAYKAVKTLANRGDVKAVASADYTVLTTDMYRSIFVTTGASNRTINLPAAASSSGRILVISKVDSGAGKVIVDGNSSETIDGSTTYSLFLQYDAIEIICDGSNWNISNKKERPVVARYTTNTAINIVADTVINFEDIDYDSHSAVTIGAAWKFTAPKSGVYSLRSSFSTAAATSGTLGDNVAIYAQVNASGNTYYVAIATSHTTSSANKRGQGGATVRLNASDYVQFFGINNTGQTHTLDTSTARNFVEVSRLGDL